MSHAHANHPRLYFPFENVNKDELISGDKYYIQLNNSYTHKLLQQYRDITKMPVTQVVGVFSRLHVEHDPIVTIEYAVFKQVRLMNKIYREGSCRFMLVRYPIDETHPNGFLASPDGCSTFSDSTGRTVNEEREVFFPVKKWVFGRPTEHKLVSQKALNKLITATHDDNIKTMKDFLGIKYDKKKMLGGKSSTKRGRASQSKNRACGKSRRRNKTRTISRY